MAAADRDVGDGVELGATFTKPNGELDDTTVEAFVMDPTGNVTPKTPTRLELGKYQVAFTLTMPGVWHWRITGTGNIEASTEGSITVRERRVPDVQA